MSGENSTHLKHFDEFTLLLLRKKEKKDKENERVSE